MPWPKFCGKIDAVVKEKGVVITDIFLISGGRMLYLLAFMTIGFFLRRSGLLKSKQLDWASNIVIHVLIPIVLFNCIYTSFSLEVLRQSLLFLFLMILTYGFITVLTYASGKKLLTRRDQLGAYVFGSLFCNNGYIGFPLIQVLFTGVSSIFHDDTALLYCSLSMILTNLVSGSAGTPIMNRLCSQGTGAGKISFKALLKNVAFISFLLAMAVSLWGIRLPSAAVAFFDIVTDFNAPFAMAVLGAMLSRCHLADIFTDKVMYLLCFLRLIPFPLITIALLRILCRDSVMFLSISILLGTPSAAVMPIYAAKGGGDIYWSPCYTFLSTVMSVITLPLIIFLIT